MSKRLASFTCALLCGGALSAQIVQVWETDGDQSKLLTQRAGLPLSSAAQGTSSVITVDDSTVFQTMDGFGASLTDSSATVLSNDLDAATRTSLMKELFDPATGIGLSFLRQPMGASDFSASGNYSYDDQAAGSTDTSLSGFSISHDQSAIIPLLKQALSYRPDAAVMLLPWSPPAWMKTSGTMNGGSMNTAYFPALAQYFVKTIQAYRQQGVPVSAIAVQNEPLNPGDPNGSTSYPAEHLEPADEANFIANNLGPALAAAGLGNVQIFGYEHNWDNTSYALTLLSSPAAQYLAGTSFHCYAGDPSAQNTVASAFPGKGIWFTECSGTVGSSFSGDLVWNTHNLLIAATRNGARSVSLWNLALDQNSGPHNGGCSSCRGVVTVDTSTSPPTITRNVEYYVLAHLAKFVQPGAVRVDSNSFGSGNFEDVAFLNPDGSHVLLVMNGTSGSNAFSVLWNGQGFSDLLPAGAVATYVWSALNPQFPVNGIVNAAAPRTPISPGSIISIYGANLAGATYQASTLPLTDWFGSLTLTINGFPAPLFYASPQQINAQVPWEVSPGTFQIALNAGGQNYQQTLTIAQSGLAFFTLDGTAAVALNPDYSVNSQSNPAPSNSYVILFGTGQGAVSNQPATGAPASETPLSEASGITAQASQQPVQVLFAGLAPGLVGVLQANVATPSVSSTSAVPYTFYQNSQASSTVTVWVRP